MASSSLPIRSVEQPGLEWVEKELLTMEPCWTKEPDIAIVKKLALDHLGLSLGEDFSTKSEVATLAFVRKKTSIPVPQVIAHDADLKNELGFEWMLMERHEVSWLKKSLLVQQIAEYTAQLFRIEFSGIGSLYFEGYNNDNNDNNEYTAGETIQPPFFKSTNITLDIPCGPFPSSQAYLTARLQITEHFASKLDLEDEDDAERYADIQPVLSSLRTVIPCLFPNTSPEHMLRGDLVSIVDWECVTTAPPWQAVQLPQFLKGPTYDPPDWPVNPASEVYRHDLERYEVTCLRRFFFEEMARVELRWVEVFEQEKVRADVLVALDKCENGMTVKWARGWLEAVAEGRQPRVSLTDACRNPLAMK
ncbi:hypothetical protein EJ02DRAFT_443490 [Clathrospora elynae]|uniref:Aminoglycoside phosphotransferase domain-containing protein n=1 Tax=Clathrospora elynae TaxID=706981 RepID=A0A6A5SUA0_9PLEO|nr:hypothetical protein EJ02DRAFT_443490 [Clathrospora elynae]